MFLKYAPFPKTRAAHLAFRDHRIVACVTGSRGGKTTFGAHKVLDAAIMQPGYDFDDIDRGEPYTIAVGAPTFPMLDRVVLPSVLRIIPRDIVVSPFHGTHRILKVWGHKGETWIYFLSCVQPESWQGLKLYGVWVDEFPLIKEQMYDEAQTRLSDRKGWMLLTGTPRGPNWAKTRIYDAWRDKIDPDIWFSTWRTVDNPYVDARFIEQKKKTTPSNIYKRMYEASWDVFEGQVYEEYLEQVHIVSSGDYTFILPNGEVRLGHGPRVVKLDAVVGGMDWGYGHGHPGAFVLGGLSGGRWYILLDIRAEQVLVTPPVPGADSWVTRILPLCRKYQCSAVYCDSAHPESIQQFRKAGIPAQEAIKDVLSGIECVARGIHIPVDERRGLVGDPNLLFLSDAKGCIDEMPYYHWREGSKKEEPNKINDHCMDALRYLMYTYLKIGSFRREPRYDASHSV